MKKLKVFRRESGLTQQELSAASGVVRWRISHAEVGLIRLTPEELNAIRNALVAACEKRSTRVLRSLGQRTDMPEEAIAV
jgi:predicted transcriptional regulator